MDKKLAHILVALAAIVLLAGCNSSYTPPEESQYKKDNDAFVENAVANGYTELYFLTAEYPIYYKVIKKHEGENALYPYQGSKVKIELSGQLISKEFFQKKSLMPVQVNKLVLGMQYALQSMNVGDTWEVVVPYQLGYGAYNNGYTIPAYSTLIFNVTLLEILQQ